MMKLYANLTATILTALVVTLALAGCDEGSVALDANKADKVVLTDRANPTGDTVVTNVQMIADLVEAMKCAKVDNTPYIGVKSRHTTLELTVNLCFVRGNELNRRTE